MNGTNKLYKNEPLRSYVNSQLVYNSDGRTIKKEKPSVEDFLGGDKCGPITHILGQHSTWNLSIPFNENLRQLVPPNMDKKYVVFFASCSIVEWHECQFSEWIDTWD